MGEVKRLYTIGWACGLETVRVIRETPKRYYTEHHRSMYGRKFVKKDDTNWFPSRAMAIQWMREILKKRILYIEEEVYRQKKKASGALVNLDAFDVLHGVVDADSKSEESYWMQKQREGSHGSIESD